jgi:hypothetical protein
MTTREFNYLIVDEKYYSGRISIGEWLNMYRRNERKLSGRQKKRRYTSKYDLAKELPF